MNLNPNVHVADVFESELSLQGFTECRWLSAIADFQELTRLCVLYPLNNSFKTNSLTIEKKRNKGANQYHIHLIS